jgi:guanosine-3',5'-bis(diphosphate) 3'-pyrophosphohydrolase
VASRLPASADVSRLWMMPTSGAKLYLHRDGGWQAVYAELFTEEQKAKILKEFDASLEAIPHAALEKFLSEQKYKRLEELLADIALGNRAAETVARALLAAQGEHPHAARRGSSEKILINGSERGVLSFANCCHPLPGDEIMGYLSAGKGIVVHRVECPNVPELRKAPERCIEIPWDSRVHGDYKVELRIEVANRPGVLAQVAAAIAEAGSNIENVEYKERDLTTATMLFTIEVKNRKHLADVMRRVRRLQVVTAVRRHPI